MIQHDDRARQIEHRDCGHENPGGFAAARRFGEQQRSALLSLDHRLRNNLGALLTLVDLTKRQTRDVDEFAASISAKIRVMASVYSLFSRSSFHSVDLHALIQELTPAGAEGKIEVLGCDVSVSMRQAFAIGLVLHELLHHSAPRSTMRIDIQVERNDQGRILELDLQESGGAAEPRHSLDSQLLEGLVKFELRGSIVSQCDSDGAQHHLQVRLDAIDEPKQSLAGDV
jgi:two-component sensor histidine kinase